MKNILLAFAIALIVLPRISFAESDEQIAADKASNAMYQQQALARANYIKLHPDLIAQQDKAAVAMYQQQAQARAAYIKLHPDLIAQQDKASKAYYQQQALVRAQAEGNENSITTPPVITPVAPTKH